MPSTRTQSSSPHRKPSASSKRTGIIVGAVIGGLVLILLVYRVLKAWRNRGVEIGSRMGNRGEVTQRVENDKDLEVGVIQEPLPVYQKEPKEDERRLAVGEEEREGRWGGRGSGRD